MQRPSLSLITLNCYLVPTFLLAKEEKSNCVKHAERATAIGKLASNYDIISLQEVWGPCMSQIESQLQSTSHVSTNWKSTGYDLLDTALNYVTGSGGLWFAYNDSFRLIWRESNQFNYSNTKSGKGFTLHLLQPLNYDSDNIIETTSPSQKQILLVSLHLDPSNDNNSQLKQLTQVRTSIINWLEWNIINNKSNNNNNNSSRSNNNNVSAFNSEDYLVLMNGDFNMSPHGEVYQKLIEIFDLTDEYKSFVNRNNLVEKNTYSSDRNEMVLWRNENARLDYLFRVNSINISEFIELNEETGSIVKLPNVHSQVDTPNEVYNFSSMNVIESDVIEYEKGEELSDHFPVVFKFTF